MLNIEEMRNLLRSACKTAGSQLAWAKANDISPQFVSDVLKGYRGPSESMLSALHLRRVSGFEFLPDYLP